MSTVDSERINSIQQKYDSEMQKYCDRIFLGFARYLKKGRHQYEQFLKRLFDFYLFGNYLVDEGLFENRPANEYVLKTIYAKGTIGYYATYNCLRSGCVSEACTLGRSLFEAMVNLKLMLQQDAATRMQLYGDYRFVSQWLQCKRDPHLFSADETKIINDKYNKVKSNYHPTKPYHWAWKIYSTEIGDRNLTLRHICEKLDLMEEYNRIYATLSISSHTDPHIDNMCTVNDKITVVPLFSDNIYSVGWLSASYYKEIIISMVQHINFTSCEDINIYANRFLSDLNDNYCKKSTRST